jgi:hypothetical protein
MRKIRQQQQDARQSFFRRIEEVVYQVRLDVDRSVKQEIRKVSPEVIACRKSNSEFFDWD